MLCGLFTPLARSNDQNMHCHLYTCVTTPQAKALLHPLGHFTNESERNPLESSQHIFATGWGSGSIPHNTQHQTRCFSPSAVRVKPGQPGALPNSQPLRSGSCSVPKIRIQGLREGTAPCEVQSPHGSTVSRLHHRVFPLPTPVRQRQAFPWR